MIAPAASSADSAGASSTGSEDAQSSSAPRDARVASGGGSGAVAVPSSSLHQHALRRVLRAAPNSRRPAPPTLCPIFSAGCAQVLKRTRRLSRRAFLRLRSLLRLPPGQRLASGNRRPYLLSMPRRSGPLQALRLPGRWLGAAGLLGLHRMIGQRLLPKVLVKRPAPGFL